MAENSDRFEFDSKLLKVFKVSTYLLARYFIHEESKITSLLKSSS